MHLDLYSRAGPDHNVVLAIVYIHMTSCCEAETYLDVKIIILWNLYKATTSLLWPFLTK